jgi:hypothetical protein
MMKSRQWISTVLITLVVVAILAGAGYALYRYGYMRGQQAAFRAEGFPLHALEAMPFNGPRGGENFERFREQIPPGQFGHFDGYGGRMVPGMMSYGSAYRNLPDFSILGLVFRLIFMGFVIWVVYKIVTLFTGGRSWTLSFSSANVEQREEDQESQKASRKK